MTTLEFPEITMPVAQRTELAAATTAALTLETLDLTKLAVARFGDWRAEVAATTANLSTLALDLSTAAKCKEARSLRQRLIGEPMAEARKVAAGIKSKMAATSKVVGAELEAIEGAYEQADTLILPKIEARESELAAEREAARQREEARKEKHRSGIENIRCYLTRCHTPGMTSERVANGITALMGLSFPAEEWEEFAVPAANAQCETIEAMRVLQAQLLGREQEAARLELQRQEQARVQAELEAERARIAAEAAELRRRAAEVEAAERRQREEAEAAQLARIREENERLQSQRAESERLEKLAEERRAALAAETQADIYITTGVRAEPIGAPSDEYADADPDAATRAPAEPPPETVDRDDALTAMEQEPAKPAGQYLPVSEAAIPPPAETPTFEDECRGLLEHIELAFAGKFSTQPKPSRDWWQALRAGATHLKGMLP